MNTMYFTEEHVLFRESLQDFLKKKSFHISINGREMEKLSVLFGRSLAIWAFLV